MNKIIATPSIRPFLKWAGGKFHILDKIRASLPPGSRLIEPFLGSGAIFLNTPYDQFLVSDINIDLINIFKLLKRDKHIFIEFCRPFFSGQYNNKNSFFSLRSEFNTTSDERLKSALFLYLNRHAFNGLMRYNNDGKFNTSFGAYKKPYFPELEMIAFIKKSSKVTLTCADYSYVMNKAIVGDVVYCDPPYVPLSLTANFTKYHSTEFRQSDQENLVEIAKNLAKKGITVILSNHDTELVQNLYQGADIISFDVQRTISCKGNSRSKVRELLAIFN